MPVRRPAHPAPPPKIDSARRLEYARLRTGFPSLHSFWARLADGWRDDDGRVSYEASRNYHFDREAPVAYLKRVAAVFGFRYDWLIDDKGAPTEQEEQLRMADAAQHDIGGPMNAAAMRGVMETLSEMPLQSHLVFEYRHLSAVAIKLALALIERGAPPKADTYQHAGRLVGACISAPLSTLGAAFPNDEGRMAQAYVTAAAHAVEILVHYAGRVPEEKDEPEGAAPAPKAVRTPRKAAKDSPRTKRRK